MPAFIVNSESSLKHVQDQLRMLWLEHKYLRVDAKGGRDRTLEQNSISHAWYTQLARELRENNALGWKSYCKLHFGVPILCAEDDGYREFYDRSIKNTLTYEQKLEAMKFMPVTSHMSIKQLSQYLEAMAEHFRKLGVMLLFPESES